MKKRLLLLLSLSLLGGVYQDTPNVFAQGYEIENYEEALEQGKYKVGTNLDPGEYRVYPMEDFAYFAILADSNGDDILINNNIEDIAYVTVKDGEYLELKRCFIVPFDSEEENKDKKMVFEGGVYKVGYDIEPGEYIVETSESDDSGYIAILDSSNSDQDIISNENFVNQTFITIEDGQYLELSRSIIDLNNQ